MSIWSSVYVYIHTYSTYYTHSHIYCTVLDHRKRIKSAFTIKNALSSIITKVSFTLTLMLVFHTEADFSLVMTRLNLKMSRDKR